ncbi:hypothetical protein ASF47_18585 [Nocardioides sp. Leaf285]|nr:hypothetical protein ASF47_18585 [Nocardioides sp. Leaf285]
MLLALASAVTATVTSLGGAASATASTTVDAPAPATADLSARPSTRTTGFQNPDPYLAWPDAADGVFGDLAFHPASHVHEYPWNFGVTAISDLYDTAEPDDARPLKGHPGAAAITDAVEIDTGVSAWARVSPHGDSETFLSTRARLVNAYGATSFATLSHTRVTYWFTYLDTNKQPQRVEFRVDRRNAPYLPTTDTSTSSGSAPSERWSVLRNGRRVACPDWTAPGVRTAHLWADAASDGAPTNVQHLTHQVPLGCVGSSTYRAGMSLTAWRKDPASAPAKKNPAAIDGVQFLADQQRGVISIDLDDLVVVGARRTERSDSDYTPDDAADYDSIAGWAREQNMITAGRNWDPYASDGAAGARPTGPAGRRPFVFVDPQATSGRASRYVVTLTPTDGQQATIDATVDGAPWRCANRQGVALADRTRLVVSIPRPCLPPLNRMLVMTSERNHESPPFLTTQAR